MLSSGCYPSPWALQCPTRSFFTTTYLQATSVWEWLCCVLVSVSLPRSTNWFKVTRLDESRCDFAYSSLPLNAGRTAGPRRYHSARGNLTPMFSPSGGNKHTRELPQVPKAHIHMGILLTRWYEAVLNILLLINEIGQPLAFFFNCFE